MQDRALTRDDLPFPLDRPINGQDLLAFLNRVVQPLWTQAANAYLPLTGQVVKVNPGPPKTLVVADVFTGTQITCRYDTNVRATVGATVYGVRAADEGVAIGVLA